MRPLLYLVKNRPDILADDAEENELKPPEHRKKYDERRITGGKRFKKKILNECKQRVQKSE
jgi:hypothetical protein